MKLVDLIAAALGFPADQIRSVLQQAADALGPDLNGGVLNLLLQFEQAVTPESINDLVGALPSELTEILKGHFNPRNQPGGFA